LIINTKILNDVTKSGSSISNPNWAIENGTPKDRLSLYNSYTPVEEVASAIWLSEHRLEGHKIYSDIRGEYSVLNAYGMISTDAVDAIVSVPTTIEAKSYVYLRRLNILDGLMEGHIQPTGIADVLNSTILISLLEQNGKLIYSNGGSCIYYVLNDFEFSSQG
jgi:uncharacterized membrane protein